MLGLSISCYYGAEKHGQFSVVCLQCGQVAAFNIVNSSIDQFSFNFTMNIQRLQFILHYELYNFHKDYVFDWMQLDWKFPDRIRIVTGDTDAVESGFYCAAVAVAQTTLKYLLY